MHLTREASPPDLPFFWLVTPETPEPPPTGAHTFNRADSGYTILNQEVFDIKVCGGNCTPSTNWYVTEINPTDTMIVVTAVFSK